ncbi:YdcF family protein [Thermodesulfatator atlanticus]|uniref:YdcF family protein n=1 Tax=Thermodesulfatator atlanticus TaxID=501497 RepID=UPI0003B2EF41|nr:ElyC/SanA/YdcF family protein [Thermodesulfatator atlanticus]
MDLLFTLKKIIQALVMPSGLVFIFLFLAFIANFSRYRKSQVRVFLVLAFLTFYSCATFLPRLLLHPLENKYQIPTHKELVKAKAIVLLPCYISDKPGQGLVDRLGGETAKRFLSALRLAKEFPEKPLIIVGAGAKGHEGASYLLLLAKELGVEKVEAFDKARDTISSAKILRGRLKDKPFLLVTAAYHMPRSVYLFKKEGLTPIPYPAYRVSQGFGFPSFSDFWPRPINLFYSDIAAHEYLGLAFYWLRDHIPLNL